MQKTKKLIRISADILDRVDGAKPREYKKEGFIERLIELGLDHFVRK